MTHREGTTRGRRHLLALDLHVAAGQYAAEGMKSYKKRRQRAVNAQRRTLVHVMAAVMEGEIRCKEEGISGNVEVSGQRAYQALEPASFITFAEILHPYVWTFPQTRVLAGNTGWENQNEGLSLWSVGVCSIFAQYQVKMVRPRQRMLRRRGSSRGGSACSQTSERTDHCCHCHLTRSSGANPLQFSQYMDSEASGEKELPAFGSAIFNFVSAMSNAKISAHVSVLFIENDKEEEASHGNQGRMTSAPEVSEMVKEQKGKEEATKKEADMQFGQTTGVGQGVDEETLPAEAKEEN